MLVTSSLRTVLCILIIATATAFGIGAQTGHAATINAASCSLTDVQSAVNRASSGDTVILPAGTCTWTGVLTLEKDMTLQGAGVGQTIIRDAVQSGPLIAWSCSPNGYHRLTGLEFRDGGRASQLFSGIVEIYCLSNETARLRIDHNKFDHLNGFHLRPHDAIGVIDNNTFLTMPTRIPIYPFHTVWRGLGNYGDNSWTADVNWGSSEFLFVENNTIAFDSGSQYACWDNFRGFRGVARFNTLIGCEFEQHGTDTSGRDRGTRAVEIYKNNFNLGGAIGGQIADLRSGSALIWGNRFDNRAPGYGNARVATLVFDRSTFYSSAFGEADGRNAWDINDSRNPYMTAKASGGGALTVMVAGAGWAANQWAGYIIHKTSSCLGNCSSVVWSNTADTITFLSAYNHGPDLTFTNGETFELNILMAGLDQPGRGGGGLFNSAFLYSCSHSGTTASCSSKTPHGLSTGQRIQVEATLCPSCSNPRVYDGSYIATVTGPTTFSYTLSTTPQADSSCCAGAVLGIPLAWNDQTDFPVYEWLNTADGSLIHSAPHPTCNTCRENRHYYNYTTGFNGSVGVGVGTAAGKPLTCTAGVAYWATDEGEWDSTHNGPDGRLYKCIATNTWAVDYTPYAYPHPLTLGDGLTEVVGGTTGGTTGGNTGGVTTDSMVPTPGNAGLIGSSTNADSATLTWTKASDNVTAQSALQYEVRLSTRNDIGTVPEAETYGAIAVPYTTDINSAVVPGWNPGTTYYFNVIVRDGAGNRSAYTTKSVTATVSDSSPPSPGNSGLISSSSTSNSASLNWTRATDNVSAQSTLRYEVLLSTRNDINTLAGAEAYGAIVKNYTTDLTSYLVTGLNPGKTYYFNVIVRDEAGNKAVYAMKSVTTTTLLDTTAPTPGNSGIITSSANTNTVTLVWSKASDDVADPSTLQYEVRMSTERNIGAVDEAEANGVLAQRYTADINTATVTGLNSGTVYYFNVIVKDEAGNKAPYSMRSQTTGGKKVTQTTNSNYKNGFFKNASAVSSDTTPPMPGDSGKILMSGISSSSLTLAWTLASDDLTPQASLQYEVLQSSFENMNTVVDAEANGTVVFGFTANISSVVVSRAAGAPQYYYTVIVRDDGGNKAVYSTAGSLGLRYSYSANGTKAFQTASLATSTLSMNHLRVSPDQGSVPPAGIAIVKTAPGGKLVSEAGFALSAGTQSGRLYVETSAATDTADGITTGVAFSNPSAQDAEVSYSFIDAAGSEVRSGLYLLPANQQFSAFLDQSPFNSPNGFKGTFTFSSSIPIGTLAMRGVTNKTGEFLFSALPMAAQGGSSDSPILPLFADGAGWSTQVVLMNKSSAVQSGTVQFFGQGSSSDAAPAMQMTVNGVTGTSFTYSIPPRSIARLITAGSSPTATGGSVRITPAAQDALAAGAAPDAFAIVSFKENGTIVTETSFSAAPTGTAFRSYVESTTSPEIANSTVAFANPSASTNVVTFQFLQLDGTPVGTAVSIAVPAGSQMSRFVRELYAGLPEQFRGQLRVTSAAPIAVSTFRTKYNAQGDFIFTPTAVMDEANPSMGLTFPLVATGGGYDTQVVLFGPAGQAGAGEMLFYSKDGVIRTGSSLDIAP